MGELLAQVGGWKDFRRGEIVEGVVMSVDQESVLVNIGGKSEGIITSQEMRSLTSGGPAALRLGDRILAYVMRPEGEDGPALLSVDRARGEHGWRLLEQCLEGGQPLDAQVVGFNRGGLIVDAAGVQGFVPLSHLAPLSRDSAPAGSEDALAHRVGKTLRLKVLELDRRRNRVILSEKVAWQLWREEQKERLLKELREGEVRRGRVSGISSFGVFVDLGGADGLIHVSELSWQPVSSPEELVKVGDEVEVYILKLDPQGKKISLSLRRLQPEPWATITQRYTVGQLVTGTITRLTTFGAFARIEGSIEGLIHISELSNKPIRNPQDAVREGDVVSLKILRIETERRRLALSLRQALEEM
ncbi:MAG: 30S ribosomal protein S1 [Chloroflexi bacterium]|nr:30S ribosomal protein S1 [Chloroflexota bacterium]